MAAAEITGRENQSKKTNYLISTIIMINMVGRSIRAIKIEKFGMMPAF